MAIAPQLDSDRRPPLANRQSPACRSGHLTWHPMSAAWAEFFMATNLQTGSGWRFAKDYAADHRVGRIDRPDLPLSRVVAASSAFPPVLSRSACRFRPA